MDREQENVEKTDPEGHRYGNFINYYTFHPAQERIEQLPQGIWSSCNLDSKYSALDIGCNAGVNIINKINYTNTFQHYTCL